MRPHIFLAVLAAIVSGSSAAQSQKLDRLQVYEGEMQRCVRYYLSDEKKGRAMALLGIHPEDLCRCSTPIFVSGLSDQEVTGLYRSAEGFTPAIINRFLLSGRVCVERLSR